MCVNAHLSLNTDVNTDQLSVRLCSSITSPDVEPLDSMIHRQHKDFLLSELRCYTCLKVFYICSRSFYFYCRFCFTSSLHWLLTFISQKPAASLKFSPSSGAAEWDVTAAVLTCRSEVGLTVGVTLQSPRAPRYLCDRAEASTHLTDSDFTALTNTSSSFWLQNQFFLNLNDLKWIQCFCPNF